MKSDEFSKMAGEFACLQPARRCYGSSNSAPRPERASVATTHRSQEVAVSSQHNERDDLGRRVEALEAAVFRLTAELDRLRGSAGEPPLSSARSRSVVLEAITQRIAAEGGSAKLTTSAIATEVGLHQTLCRRDPQDARGRGAADRFRPTGARLPFADRHHRLTRVFRLNFTRRQSMHGAAATRSACLAKPGSIPGFSRCKRQNGATARPDMDGMTRIEERAVARRVGGERTETDLPSALQQCLTELEHLDASRLRQEWRRLFRSDPPQLSRDLVLRALAYRLQEREQGGLSKATLRTIAAQTRELRADDPERAEPRARLRPGGRLVQEWRGRTHTVTVIEDGFEYAGKTYASLTPIARIITGAHWSGPRFFGLVRQRAPKAVPPDGVPPTAAPSREKRQHGPS